MQKNRVKIFVFNNYHLVSLIFVFITFFMLLLKVNYASDDWTYKQAAICDWNEMVSFLKWHILNVNGRTLVHAVVLLFLRYKPGLMIWRFVCALSVTFSCYLSGKIAFESNEKQKKATVLFSVIIMLIDPVIWQTSICWLTGSFNYVIPTAFLLLLIYRTIRKKKYGPWTCFLALCCGASTEQVGMMTIGLFVLLILDGLLSKSKLNIKNVFGFCWSTIGYISIILSPGTTKRSSYFDLKFSPQMMIVNGIKLLKENWINNIHLVIFNIIMCVGIALVIYRISSGKIVSKIVSLVLMIMSCLNIVFTVYIKFLGNNFSDLTDKIIFAIWIAYVALAAGCIIYLSLKMYFSNISKIYILCMILGIGSQFMLTLVHNNEERTLQPSLFCIAIAVTIMITLIDNRVIDRIFSQGNHKYRKKFIVLMFAVVFASCFQYGIANIKNLLPMKYDEKYSVNPDLLDEDEHIRSLDNEEIQLYENWLSDSLQGTQQLNCFNYDYDVEKF